MEKATRYPPGDPRPVRRRGKPPRLVVWLALLIALFVAALGAALTRETPSEPSAVRHGT
jgi:hypothetical protein